jgi:two-component system response regulator MprA
VQGSRNVLVIEDDPDIRAAIADALTYEGHSVVEAADGIEGLEHAHEHRPDLILLDLMMPRMDGWAFRDAQQHDAGLADVPVVIVSACMADEVHSLGAVGHLHKPFNMDELLEVVGRCASAA